MISEYCDIVCKKPCIFSPLISIWTPWSRKRKNSYSLEVAIARATEDQRGLSLPPEYVGPGVKTSSFAFWLIPACCQAHHRSSGSQACWLTQNPNTQATSHCWTQGAVNRSLNTHRSSHTRDFSHPLRGFKELIPFPEVSVSLWVGLRQGQIRLALNGEIWHVVTKLGVDPKTPTPSGVLESHFSV